MERLENTHFILRTAANRLKNDRETCSTSSSENELFLCQQEAKVVRFFSRVLLLSSENSRELNETKEFYEKLLAEWLEAVNVSKEQRKKITEQYSNLKSLVEMPDAELNLLSKRCSLLGEDARRFSRATTNLWKFTRKWKELGREPNFSVEQLCWYSFERHNSSSSADGAPGERRSVSESGMDSGASDSGVGSNVSNTSLPTTTPPPSPGLALTGNTLSVHSAAAHSKLNRGPTPPRPARAESRDSPEGSDSKSTSTTPPPTLRWGTSRLKPESHMELPNGPLSPTRVASGISRSHSHESNLQNRILVPAVAQRLDSPGGLTKPATLTISRSEHDHLGASSPHEILSPDAAFASPSSRGPNSPWLFIPGDRPEFPRSASTSGMGNPPKSPRTGGRIFHVIPHQFRRKYNPNSSCAVCKKSFGMRSGEKCKSCKIKVHTECKSQLSEDTCGLKKEHVTEIIKLLVDQKDHGDYSHGRLMHSVDSSAELYHQHLTSPQAEIGADGSSSSCNSSAPSTPAPGPWASPFPYTAPGCVRKFTFPDLPEQPEVPNITIDGATEEGPGVLVESNDSYGSTVRIGSQGSGAGTGSERTLSGNEELGESTEEGENRLWRNHWNQETLRGAWREVTIPFEQISFPADSLIGRGRFGEVHKGYWHQDVAVKLLNMDHVSDENALETFKMEVASFKNTRHDNIVLFVGYCLDPPKLGIVMNFCKGRTLHHILHHSRDRLDLGRVLSLATQTTQGMSYLHGKRILHKDLRTKNIFVEPNNKVVITDFGLFSLQRLLKQGDHNSLKSLRVPDRWLCYLAPELMRSLFKSCLEDGDLEELPFSHSTDVYAFGTVWYELLSGEFPFNKLPPESIIWQVGKGMRPPLGNFQGPKELKDILVQCWNFDPDARQDFNQLFKALDKIPKKRLLRSPSHPIHLSRSAESMF